MRFLLTALALVLGTTTPAFAQSGLAGNWALSFSTPGGPRETTAVFKVDGDAVTGTMSTDMGEMPVKGTVKDNAFTLSMDVQTQNGTITVNLAGDVDGDTLKGTMDFSRGTGEFTGKRK